MKEYLKFTSAAMLAMFAGSQIVHRYYNPLKDLNYYVDREIKAQRLRVVVDRPEEKGNASRE